MTEYLPGMPKTGQTVLVTGKIRTQKFPCNGDKEGSSIRIIAKQMYLCEDSECLKNQNHIELLAYICFEISNRETYSVFILGVHYQKKYVYTYTYVIYFDEG